MRPTLFELLAAAILFIALAGMVVAIVVATVPAGGAPTLN